jgi:hypothetical protein
MLRSLVPSPARRNRLALRSTSPGCARLRQPNARCACHVSAAALPVVQSRGSGSCREYTSVAVVTAVAAMDAETAASPKD